MLNQHQSASGRREPDGGQCGCSPSSIAAGGQSSRDSRGPEQVEDFKLSSVALIGSLRQFCP